MAQPLSHHMSVVICALGTRSWASLASALLTAFALGAASKLCHPWTWALTAWAWTAWPNPRSGFWPRPQARIARASFEAARTRARTRASMAFAGHRRSSTEGTRVDGLRSHAHAAAHGTHGAHYAHAALAAHGAHCGHCDHAALATAHTLRRLAPAAPFPVAHRCHRWLERLGSGAIRRAWARTSAFPAPRPRARTAGAAGHRRVEVLVLGAVGRSHALRTSHAAPWPTRIRRRSLLLLRRPTGRGLEETLPDLELVRREARQGDAIAEGVVREGRCEFRHHIVNLSTACEPGQGLHEGRHEVGRVVVVALEGLLTQR
mmetsp:Transcript_30112/g.64098  ORF Transcript_30112/g.64098 Transcript_30112/m.64098 type:complete len:318 (+) Transcript_30112:102-1055(+)